MEFTFEINNSAGTVEINIEGTIGCPIGDGSKESAIATYNEFTRKIREIGASNARKVVVNIRSTGGDVNDALLIYEQLKSLKAKVVTQCYGYTASAATIIAQAASEGERRMSENALYLIHQSTTTMEGNTQKLSGGIELLRKTDERIAKIYADASGRPAEEFLSLMSENNGRGKWLSAEEALSAGLIDEIIGSKPIQNINKEELFGLPEPPQINDKMEQNEKKDGLLDRISAWFENKVEGEVQILNADLALEKEKVANLTSERDSLQTLNEEHTATIANLNDEIAKLKADNAELKAMQVQPTVPAQSVQDPNPTPAPPQPTANEEAYAKDVEAFK